MGLMQLFALWLGCQRQSSSRVVAFSRALFSLLRVFTGKTGGHVTYALYILDQIEISNRDFEFCFKRLKNTFSFVHSKF